MMRESVLIAVLAAVLAAGCAKGVREESVADLLGSYHFLGTRQLAGNTNAAKLRDIGNLRATSALLEQVLEKCAQAPRELLALRLASTNADHSSLLRPALDDVIREETFARWQRTKGEVPEFFMAARLPAERNSLWQTNFWQLMRLWEVGTPRHVTTATYSGWEVLRSEAPNRFQFLRAGDWTFLDLSAGQSPALRSALDQLKKTGRPMPPSPNHWLQVEVDGPQLLKFLGLPEPAPLPKVRLTMVGKGENLRSEAQIAFREDVVGPFDPWQPPTNTVREPLVSFTALRGINPWLKRFPFLSRLNLDPMPDQYYLWSRAQTEDPFQTFAAFLVHDRTNMLSQIDAKLPPLVVTNMQQRSLGQIEWRSNRTELYWTGLPFIVPFLRAAPEPGDRFLVGGIFPPVPHHEPIPPELLAQFIGRTNLLYYAWEHTQPRLAHWLPMFQIYSIVWNKSLPKTTTAGMQWLVAMLNPDQAAHTPAIPASPVSPSAKARAAQTQLPPLQQLLTTNSPLQNAVTEILIRSPKELSLVRTSQTGLTAFELLLLSRWLDEPRFPFGGYQLPLRQKSYAPLASQR